ncbi:MAG TPA: alpha/beta fold hydrolase [Kineosporiaceae bacterium]|nr:alpha/beta fold hydrolase [Kineosporiaceae bacterium]
MPSTALPQHVRVAVIGAGFGGIGAAHALRRAGITDVAVLERRPGIGGTWWDNTYPGIACDVASHLYSFSFAPNPRWSRTFAPGQEIQRYLEEVVDRLALRQLIHLGAEVTAAGWDDGRGLWTVRTTRGDLTAQILVAATGPLSQPSLPQLPGLEDFPGPVFHTAQWRHDVDLSGRRVAVVGTGASAVQVVPQLQPKVDRLLLFQRTPAWVLPKGDRAITSLERTLYRRVPALQKLARAGIYLGREALVPAFVRHPAALRAAELVSRRHLERSIRDPRLRATLTPDYRLGCKRILPSNDYYPALARPNIEVIPEALERLEGGGTPGVAVGTGGTRREVDAVVLATGFAATHPVLAHLITGRDGRTLAQVWDSSGMQALRGTTVAGFPNLFLVIGPNTGLGHGSMVHVIESQLAYLVDAVRTMDADDRAVVEPTTAAQQAWNRALQEAMPHTVWSRGGCTSWYLDAHGRNTTLWPHSTLRLRRELRRFDRSEYRTRPGPGIRRSTVTSADGTAIAVHERGPADAPRVVLVHGWTLAASFWSAVAADLARDHHVVCYDQRGHGDSGRAGDLGYSSAALAADLTAVLGATVGDGRRAVLGGHSMGAMTILALAAADPELLRSTADGILLASTGCDQLLSRSSVLPLPRAVTRFALPLMAEVMSRPPAAGRDGALARLMIRLSGLDYRAGRQAVSLTTRTVLTCPPQVQRGFADMLWSLDLTQAPARVGVPTHVLVGAHDRLTPPWHARRLAATLPDCTGLTVVPRVGHMTPVECPGVVAQRLRDLVRLTGRGCHGSPDTLPSPPVTPGRRSGSRRPGW